jgi:uncharacterized protein (TIGR00251 family)
VIENMIPIQDSQGAITFAIKVQPRAKRDALVGELGDALKLALIAPPVEGRANEACIRFLAEFLKVPRSSITIASGQNSRRKLIRITGITAEQFRARLTDGD